VSEAAVEIAVEPRRDGLGPGGRRAAIALAEALWSRDGIEAPPADRVAWFADDLADFVGRIGGRAWLLFRACLATATWIAPVVIGRAPPLARLSIPDRIRAIAALEGTPAGLALFAAKAIVSMVWFEHPANAREIGWDQRCKRL